jgi:hypothetical protein
MYNLEYTGGSRSHNLALFSSVNLTAVQNLL